MKKLLLALAAVLFVIPAIYSCDGGSVSKGPDNTPQHITDNPGDNGGSMTPIDGGDTPGGDTPGGGDNPGSDTPGGGDNGGSGDGDNPGGDTPGGVPAGAVDLGLSVYWAECNLGATTPQEIGGFYAWGETSGKDSYDWSNYRFGESMMTKYNTNTGFGSVVDNKTVLESADDAATAALGGEWRMPTDAEMTELRTSCTWEWKSEGVAGFLVKSRTTEGSIFLPAGGYKNGTLLLEHGQYGMYTGYYWTATLDETSPISGRCLSAKESFILRDSYSRFMGMNIRPVHPKAQ